MGAGKGLTRRARLLAKSGGCCHYCGIVLAVAGKESRWRFTVDHLIPRSRGGINVMDNQAAACWRCNILKADMTEAEFRVAWPDPADIPVGPAPHWRRRKVARKRRAKARQHRRVADQAAP